MDGMMNKAKQAMSGNHQPQMQPDGTKKDFGDKAFDKVVDGSKFGKNVSESNREKATDAIRQGVEKVTGKPVNPKISN